jgi:hypothetical protein
MFFKLIYFLSYLTFHTLCALLESRYLNSRNIINLEQVRSQTFQINGLLLYVINYVSFIPKPKGSAMALLRTEWPLCPTHSDIKMGIRNFISTNSGHSMQTTTHLHPVLISRVCGSLLS